MWAKFERTQEQPVGYRSFDDLCEGCTAWKAKGCDRHLDGFDKRTDRRCGESSVCEQRSSRIIEQDAGSL
jgi:hypothetical protein